jgi:hypothetical protein
LIIPVFDGIYLHHLASELQCFKFFHLLSGSLFYRSGVRRFPNALRLFLIKLSTHGRSSALIACRSSIAR